MFRASPGRFRCCGLPLTCESRLAYNNCPWELHVFLSSSGSYRLLVVVRHMLIRVFYQSGWAFNTRFQSLHKCIALFMYSIDTITMSYSYSFPNGFEGVRGGGFGGYASGYNVQRGSPGYASDIPSYPRSAGIANPLALLQYRLCFAVQPTSVCTSE